MKLFYRRGQGITKFLPHPPPVIVCRFQMWEKICRPKTLKYITAFIVPVIFLFAYNFTLDNDSWFVLAEGRHIVNNGLYYTDVLSMHDGLDVTVQQYGFAAIFWLIYSAFGPMGLYIMMLLLNLFICYLIYKICMLLSNKNVNLSLLIMMAADIVLALNYVVTRAQMVSYIILLALIYILELYIKTNKTKYLLAIPLLSFLQINLHASVWWILLIVLFVYIIDSIKVPNLHLQGYRTKPLAIIGLVSFLLGFLNPYGIKMVTFIFKSYGVNSIFNTVNEMAPFDLKTRINALSYMAIVAVLLLYIFGKNKYKKARHLMLFFGFLGLGINSVKGMSQLILVMFLPLALMYKNRKIETIIEDYTARKAILIWGSAISICLVLGCLVGVLPNIQNSPDAISFEAVNAIDESVNIKGVQKEDLKIYTGYNDGGYLEFRGYKSYIDPRAEVYLKGNNGKKDILEEWINLQNGKIAREDFLKTYNFDYLFVRSEDEMLYNLNSENYAMIYEDANTATRVYERISPNA